MSARGGGVAGAAWEGMTQVAIMLTIGGAAGAASFTHVHVVAAAHGQDGEARRARLHLSPHAAPLPKGACGT